METIIAATLALLQGVIPLVSATSVVGQVISTLEAIVPFVIETYKDLAPTVKNIIGLLKQGDAPVTDEQMAQLDALEATIDANFDAAAAAAQAEDAAAQGTTQG